MSWTNLHIFLKLFLAMYFPFFSRFFLKTLNHNRGKTGKDAAAFDFKLSGEGSLPVIFSSITLTQ